MHKVFQELGYYLETALKMGKTNVVNMNNSQRLSNKNFRLRKMIYQVFKNLKKSYMQITVKYKNKTVSTVKQSTQYCHINSRVLLLEYQTLNFIVLSLSAQFQCCPLKMLNQNMRQCVHSCNTEKFNIH
jgi:hypothetical protein